MTGMLTGWRGLGRFWLGIVLLLGVMAVLLQSLGPPKHLSIEVRSAQPEPKAHDVKTLAAVHETKPPPGSLHPGRDVAGPIEEPNPALTQPAPGIPHAVLPRIAVDGRVPMRNYAAPFDPSNLRPRVGILVAGIGMNEADSLAAISLLPGGISLAISPYATNSDRMLTAARIADHEYLLSIPMEPQGYPLSDPDDQHALMTSLPPIDNLPRLYWALSRIGGYVGVTNALGQMHGERLSGQFDQMESVLDDISHRGLLFVDARVGKPRLPLAWNRSADILIDDEPIDSAVLDTRLNTLSQIALDKGSALGLVSLPRPKTLERVAAWTTTLTAKGLALAPVSALARPPAQEEQEK